MLLLQGISSNLYRQLAVPKDMVQLTFFVIASLGAVLMAGFLVSLCRSRPMRVGWLSRLCRHVGLSAGHVRFTSSSVHKITSAEPATRSNANIVMMRPSDPNRPSGAEEARPLRKAK